MGDGRRQRTVSNSLQLAAACALSWGGLLMAWWNGDGAASLADMARNGRDDAASRILCTVIGRLHAKGESLPQDCIPMSRWFEPLEPAASVHGGVLKRAVAIARELLDAPEDVVTLHGDIHHGNSAIQTGTSPQRLSRQVSVVAEAAGLDRERLLKWIVAWAGLSAVWILENAAVGLAVVNLALAETEKLEGARVACLLTPSSMV